jgi:hypothetical protein
MTQPTEAELVAALSVAKAAKQALQTERDKLLRSIFSAARIRLIDRWIATNDPSLDRSEAIRRPVERGLKVKGK